MALKLSGSLVFACLLSGMCGTAMAADKAVPVNPPPSSDSGWIVTVDINASLEADYPGAATRRLQYVPGISVRRAGEAKEFSSPDDGFDVAIFDADWLKAGPLAKVMGPRHINGNPELRGLRQVDWTLEVGAFAEYWPTQYFRTRAEVLQGANGHEGLLGTLAADLVLRPGAWTLSGGPRLNFGNGNYMRRYFSVSVPEALANGRVTPYAAHAGATSVGLLGAAGYEFSPTWTGTVWGEYQRLIGDAGNSPIPRVLGSRNQGSFGATLSYSFNIKGI